MTDPCEAICDAQVIYLNSLNSLAPDPENPPLSLEVEVIKPWSPNAELNKEHLSTKAMVFPFSEEEEKIGRGGQAVETFVTSLLIIRKHTDEFTRDVLSAFVREVKNALRGVPMAGYTYAGMETVSKFDPDQVEKFQQFASVVRISYRGTV